MFFKYKRNTDLVLYFVIEKQKLKSEFGKFIMQHFGVHCRIIKKLDIHFFIIRLNLHWHAFIL